MFNNFVAVHKEWFLPLKKNDPMARIIPYKDATISTENQFPKTQPEYDRAFSQRISRQPGQPRAVRIIFEIEFKENFQKTFNQETMEFLTKRGVYMKMNLSSQLWWDALGFLNHVHPKASWRADLQKNIVEALKTNMGPEEREREKRPSK